MSVFSCVTRRFFARAKRILFAKLFNLRCFFYSRLKKIHTPSERLASHLRVPLKLLDIIVLWWSKGLQVDLNWTHMMLRDTYLSDNYTSDHRCFILSGPYTYVVGCPKGSLFSISKSFQLMEASWKLSVEWLYCVRKNEDFIRRGRWKRPHGAHEKFLLHAYMESPTTHKILKNGRRHFA